VSPSPVTVRLRAGRAVAAFAIVAALTIVVAGTASAHAGLESSDPASGELLTAAPSSLELAFTEPPDLDLSSISVVDTSGAEIETGELERGRAPRSLTVSLPDDLGDGVYTVSWTVVSTADGHPTAGAFAFGVGVGESELSEAPAATEASTPPPQPLGVAGKVLLYAGLAAAVGAAATGLFAFGGVVPRRRVLLPLAGASALVGAIAMTVSEADVIGASIGELLGSRSGVPYIWLMVTTAATLGATIVAARSTSRAPIVVVGVLAASAMLVRATSGHASALVPPWPSELAQFVHFLAIGVWIGGLVWLFALVLDRRAGEEPAPAAEAARFSRMAGWALLVVVVTGVARSVGEAGGLGDVRTMLTSTSYGTALLVKVGIVVGLIGLGALNRRRSIPRLGRDDGSMLRRVVAVELVAAVGVFGLTGTLTSLNPNTLDEPAAGARPAEVTATGSDFATTTRVSLTARPGTAGPNSFVARVTDFDDGTPVEADEVSVTLAPIGRPEIEPTSLELEPATSEAAPASWTAAGTQLSIAGAWDAVVQVRAGARVTEVPLVLVTRAPPTTSVVAQGSDELPDIETFTLATGEQLQLYLDPGRPGVNEFHVTAFDAEGQELRLSGLVVVAFAPGGDGEALDVTRLTPGHFVAPVETDAGRWRFAVVATTEGGTVLQATQDQEVEA